MSMDFVEHPFVFRFIFIFSFFFFSSRCLQIFLGFMLPASLVPLLKFFQGGGTFLG